MLYSLEKMLHFKDFQTRYGGDSTIVGQKRVAVTDQRSRHVDRIGRLEFEVCLKLRRSFEKGAINFDKPETSALGRQRLITIGKRKIARTNGTTKTSIKLRPDGTPSISPRSIASNSGFTSGRKRLSSSIK